jgi:hypothetical protein
MLLSCNFEVDRRMKARFCETDFIVAAKVRTAWQYWELHLNSRLQHLQWRLLVHLMSATIPPTTGGNNSNRRQQLSQANQNLPNNNR